jgi:zinc transporter 1
MSRSARITLLLAIDVVFFFVELIVGYAVGSLALVADSFHMLNDVMSLVVALYAIKLTAKNSNDSRYSYGWHRAEILAALVNGVFLLALCFSISLEALGRFFSTPEISNPRLVVVVGSLGLASNIVGLFLFHEHGHSHGAASVPSSTPSSIMAPATGLISGQASPTQKIPIRIRGRNRSRSDSYSSLYGHPVATRASLVQAANDIASARSPSPSSRVFPRSRPSLDIPSYVEATVEEGPGEDDELTPYTSEQTPLLSSRLAQPHSGSDSPANHAPSAHTHSHAGSMNMRALVLHVLGDALGNVGVIATGLIIWFTSWSFKYYCDPIISLVITVIIFSSALPLVRSASFILLQGVPPTISLDDVRESILDVEGVLSLHELHVWQLSETKVIASVHVTASRSHDFMPVAAKIRKALHHHGIHSSTIQPEYHNPRNAPPEGNLSAFSDTSCLILCPPDQECNPSENACCPPPSTDA